MATAYLGLGSNIGNRKVHLLTAIEQLDNHPRIVVKKRSSIIETEPYGHIDQDRFLNMCVEISTELPPLELLEAVLAIEHSMGRIRTISWGPRNIDIDILIYEDLEIRLDDLTVPHEELHKRMFVLHPLAEIAANVVHPVLDRTVKELKQQLEKGDD